MKIKQIWDRIKPLNYQTNPIGSLKVEIMMWLCFVSILNYISGVSYITNKFMDTYQLPQWFCIISVVLIWCRLATVVSKYMKQK